ncbi:MAG: hypothetical protein D6725_09560 [Planctomycetota bacterium]|nr:MAG: hypothetical protein D6725_09560 [Planctomycetota bacterium]
MRTIAVLAIVGVLSGAVATASAADYPFTAAQPVLVAPGQFLAFAPKPAPPPAEEQKAAKPAPAKPAPQPVPDVALYPCVKYRDLHNIPPCAQTMIVEVPDPCQQRPKPCKCKCHHRKPTCAAPKVTCGCAVPKVLCAVPKVLCAVPKVSCAVPKATCGCGKPQAHPHVCGCCQSQPIRMVKVAICVPSCQPCPPKITRRQDGWYTRYDFGKYAVDIRVKKHYVEVDYDD